MFSVQCLSDSHNVAAKGTFVFHDDVAPFSFQKWIRSMNASALISLPSIVHFLCGTKKNSTRADGLSIRNVYEWNTVAEAMTEAVKVTKYYT